MKKIKKRWLLGIPVCLLAAGAAVLFRIGSRPSSLSLPADTFGVSASEEISWKDGLFGKLVLSDGEGETVYEQRLSASSGTISLSLDTSGAYTVSLYSLFGREKDQKTLTVTESAVFTEKASTQLGEQTVIRLQTGDEELGENAWIGVYAKDAVPGQDESILWQKLSDILPGQNICYAAVMRGSTNLFLSYTGEYTVYLFLDKGYDAVGSWDFSTTEEADTVSIRWDPSHGGAVETVFSPGDAQGYIRVNGRPDSGSDGEALWVCWGKDGKPLKDYTPIFQLNAYAHYPVSGEISAHSVFPEGATEILACSDANGTPGEVVASAAIQPELRDDPEGTPEVSFAVVSDSHLTRRWFTRNNYHFYRALAQLNSLSPDFIFDNGDVTDNGNAAEYKNLQRILRLFPGLPELYYSIGNHDSDKNRSDFAPLEERFLSLTGTDKVYYSFTLGGNTFIVLGNEGAYPIDDPDYAYLSQQQLDWLDETLSSAEGEAFVFVHQPLEETVAATFEGSDLSDSAALMEIIERYPNTMLISGHTHRSISGTLALRTENGFPGYLHDGVVSSVWDGVGETGESEGIYLTVYPDEIRITGRDFTKNSWIGLCNWRISRKNDKENTGN